MKRKLIGKEFKDLIDALENNLFGDKEKNN